MTVSTIECVALSGCMQALCFMFSLHIPQFFFQWSVCCLAHPIWCVRKYNNPIQTSLNAFALALRWTLCVESYWAALQEPKSATVYCNMTVQSWICYFIRCMPTTATLPIPYQLVALIGPSCEVITSSLLHSCCICFGRQSLFLSSMIIHIIEQSLPLLTGYEKCIKTQTTLHFIPKKEVCSVLLSTFTSWSDCSHSIFRFLHTYPGVVLVHFKTSWKVSVAIGIESVLSKASLIFLTELLSKSASLYRFTSLTIADRHVETLLRCCCAAAYHIDLWNCEKSEGK